jgi:ribulose-phosphate 3-epimerase
MKKEKHSFFICPSVLSADFAHLADEVQKAELAGADRLHVDIMDGHFVPNLSMGPKIVAAINRSTNLFLHVHLMVYNPFDFVERFVEAGADQISFHLEATEDVEDTLEYIRRCGVRSGIAVCPETPVSMVFPHLSLLDEILIMTVNPGFGGQSLIPETIEKIREARYWVEKEGAAVNIAVDGGINEETAITCSKAGANVFVAGTYLFESSDMTKTISSMRKDVLANFGKE